MGNQSCCAREWDSTKCPDIDMTQDCSRGPRSSLFDNESLRKESDNILIFESPRGISEYQLCGSQSFSKQAKKELNRTMTSFSNGGARNVGNTESYARWCYCNDEQSVSVREFNQDILKAFISQDADQSTKVFQKTDNKHKLEDSRKQDQRHQKEKTFVVVGLEDDQYWPEQQFGFTPNLPEVKVNNTKQ